MSSQPKQPLKLTKLRKGLTLAFNDYDLNGKPQWLIHDPGRNKFFIIGWIEYEILMRWHLADVDTIVDEINTKTTLHVEASDVENFYHFLSYNYLVEQGSATITQHARSQKIFKDENIFHWLTMYYLFFRIPLVHPDRFLDKTKRIADIIFSRYVAYLMIGLALIALYQINIQWERFTHTFPTIFNFKGFVLYLFVYMIVKLLHELGHAYMCKRYDVPVPSLGIAFLVFWPVLYTDTTLSWTLHSRERLRIALAGMWIETYVTIIAALIWAVTNNTTIQSICFLVIAVNWISSLAINVSPFMRFDGYYVLADLLRMPNLQFRAFALTRWQIRRWLFDWPEPPPEKFTRRMHIFLIAYSFATWIYRLILYIGIAVLVYHFFIKILGILLFCIEMYYFILGPIISELYFWFSYRDKIKFNVHTCITLSVTVLLILLFIIPIKDTVKLPATASYSHQFLYAPDEAIINSPLPTSGTVVKANQPIIELFSPSIDYSLKRVHLDYSQKLAELRRSSVNQDYSHQKEILLSDLKKLKAQYQQLINLYHQLQLKVPFNGMVVDVATGLQVGTVIKKHEWLADVINLTAIEIEAYVQQIDLKEIKVGLSGYFYPDDLSEPRLPVKIISIEPLNPTQLSCTYSQRTQEKQSKQNTIIDTPCYNVSELGGNIATYLTDEGTYVPVNSVYRVLLKTEQPIPLKRILRGTVVINTQSRSYAIRLFHDIKRVLIEQSAF